MEAAEAAVVVDIAGQPIYWHLPAGRSIAAIPDSRALWLVLWKNRTRLAGVAHTHPAGILRPSSTDLRTFAACEDGLGRRLSWWIVTPAAVVVCSYRDSEPGQNLSQNSGQYSGHYSCRPDPEPHAWLAELRRKSWPLTDAIAAHSHAADCADDDSSDRSAPDAPTDDRDQAARDHAQPGRPATDSKKEKE